MSAAQLPELAGGDVYVYAHGNGAIFVMDAAHRSERMPLDDVLQTLKDRPKDVHVVITGRRCPPEIIELADTVTEMTKVKHAFNAGVPAQRGIED